MVVLSAPKLHSTPFLCVAHTCVLHGGARGVKHTPAAFNADDCVPYMTVPCVKLCATYDRATHKTTITHRSL